jgi:Transglycosylase SLT domain
MAGGDMTQRTAATVRKSDTKNTIPLFAEKPSHPFAPLACQTAAARGEGQGRPPGRRLGALPLTEASTVAGWQLAGRMVLPVTLSLVLAVSSSVMARAESPPPGMSASTPSRNDVLASFVSEAAQRFDIPAAWIRAVIQVESNGEADAVSPRGAMGLMQIMPGTYQDMRLRYGLGADPFQPSDNIIAGTAYLREMLDCYGMAGFLAAYNAGPERYDAHLASGQPLPPETVLYVARITPMLAGVQSGSTMIAPPLYDWRHAPLFAGHISVGPADASLAADVQSGGNSAARSPSAFAALIPQPTGMFASHFASASP